MVRKTNKKTQAEVIRLEDFRFSNTEGNSLDVLAQLCRISVFEMLYQRGNGHWGGSSSVAELLATLYFHIMNIDPANPHWEERDRLVLSKGHAAPIYYTLLAHRGYFTLNELKSSFRTLGSRFQGHPHMGETPGVDMSTGALGHGVSVGLGMALAARIQNRNFWTFVVIGDGDLNEGVTWEAIMAAAKFKPRKFVVLVDYNKVQLDGNSDDIMPMDPLLSKLKAFNMTVPHKHYDGHNTLDILESWEWMKQNEERPMAVVYNTVKGKGISFTENNFKWHGASIDKDSFEKGMEELQAGLNLISAPDE